MPGQNDPTIKQKVEYIFNAMEKTEISILIFSKLSSLSRPTLYRWQKGENITDHFRLNYAHALAMRLYKAYQLGKLPLKEKLKKSEKIREIKRIVKEVSP